MALSIRAEFEEIRTLGFGAIGAIYMGIGTSLDYPAREVLLQNFTDVMMVFSDDGITDKFKLPKNTGYVIDVAANKATNAGNLCIDAGTRWYVRQDTLAPTRGEVCVSPMYSSEG